MNDTQPRSTAPGFLISYDTTGAKVFINKAYITGVYEHTATLKGCVYYMETQPRGALRPVIHFQPLDEPYVDIVKRLKETT